MSKEIWKNIKDAKGYQVSDQGRVRNEETEKVLASFKGKLVVFSVEGKPVCRSINKLVAQAFLPKYKAGTRVYKINPERAPTAKNLRVGGKE